MSHLYLFTVLLFVLLLLYKPIIFHVFISFIFYVCAQSQDESSLIWISSSGERSLKLASVSKIIPGQRTVRFHCFNILYYYLSFYVTLTHVSLLT